MKRTEDIKKLLVISIVAFASAAILFAAVSPTLKEQMAVQSGFNAEVPDASTQEKHELKSETYRMASPTDTMEKRADTVSLAIQKTLDDIQTKATKTEAPAPPRRKPGKKPVAAKADTTKSTETADTVKAVEKRRQFIGTGTGNATKESDIEACIHEDQRVKDKDRVRLRITKDCRIQGIEVKAGTVVTGTASVSGSRIMIEVRYVKVSGKIIETNLSVFDNDCSEGLFYPESATEKAARGTGSDLVRSIASSIGAGAGIAGSIVDGGSDFLTEKMENASFKLYGNHKVTLVEK